MTRRLLIASALIIFAAATAIPAFAAGPVNRWGLDYNRAARPPRAGDPFVHKPPARTYRRTKPAEVEAEVPPLPRYGKPKPAIERIPGT